MKGRALHDLPASRRRRPEPLPSGRVATIEMRSAAGVGKSSGLNASACTMRPSCRNHSRCNSRQTAAFYRCPRTSGRSMCCVEVDLLCSRPIVRSEGAPQPAAGHHRAVAIPIGGGEPQPPVGVRDGIPVSLLLVCSSAWMSSARRCSAPCFSEKIGCYKSQGKV